MGKKILIVDDEHLVSKSIERLLKKKGYEVFICSDGDAAIRKVEGDQFDLVICDIRMPKLSGIDTIKQIRSITKARGNKSPKEIMITGYADDDLIRDVEALKVGDYIHKPFDVRDLLNSIKSILGE